MKREDHPLFDADERAENPKTDPLARFRCPTCRALLHEPKPPIHPEPYCARCVRGNLAERFREIQS